METAKPDVYGSDASSGQWAQLKSGRAKPGKTWRGHTLNGMAFTLFGWPLATWDLLVADQSSNAPRPRWTRFREWGDDHFGIAVAGPFTR